ncbi:MAG TPA: NTP transferase domain-containing protein [Candidatus Brocadiia bacterium]|nr:NTP transferase domain-containing protein [Planctomycetota bacterium]MDO8092142.1 NTP transferase domain-containing protein [Candidatus Brocadiales bacterium]
MTKETLAIVLAAGKGTRMKSDKPKVLHEIFGKPLLEWVITAVRGAGISRILVVVGYQGERVIDAFKGFNNLKWIDQHEQLGTGHAVKTAGVYLGGFSGNIVVLPGDAPLIKAKTIRNLLECHYEYRADCTILTAKVDNPQGYGRICRNKEGKVIRIIEEVDAIEEEREINEVNSGIYCFNAKALFDALDTVAPTNRKGEYYLTDVIAVLHAMNKRIETVCISESLQIFGVNTLKELAEIVRWVGINQKAFRMQLT